MGSIKMKNHVIEKRSLRLARVKVASPEWRMSGHEQYDVARTLLALAADLEAAERERDEWKQGAFKFDEERRAAERERDDLLRQRVELQNSIGGYVTQVDKLCEQRAQAWRDLDFWMTDAKKCAVAHDKLADDLATAREALELLRFSPNEECWCSARSIDVPEFHTATCERVRELLKNV